MIIWDTEKNKLHKKYLFNYDDGIYGTILCADFFEKKPFVIFSNLITKFLIMMTCGNNGKNGGNNGKNGGTMGKTSNVGCGMDIEIGRVLAQIESMGALDNTLVMFLSDNGASPEQILRGDGHDPAAAPGSAKTYLGLGAGWSTAGGEPTARPRGAPARTRSPTTPCRRSMPQPRPPVDPPHG